MNEKQEQLFERITETQYAWLRLRGIIQNQFTDEHPYPCDGEIKEWKENVNSIIRELESIEYDVLDYIDCLKREV